MADIHERAYEIAKDAVAQQERQVSEMRTRATALLAGGLVAAGLLADAVFHGGHPDGTGEWVATIAGFSGAGVLLIAVVVLASPWRIGFTASGSETYDELVELGVIEQPSVDVVLAKRLDERYARNQVPIDKLRAALWVALVALVIEIAGLAIAAAVSS